MLGVGGGREAVGLGLSRGSTRTRRIGGRLQWLVLRRDVVKCDYE
jgi:hypothetical protein